jgi:hypothetical protein
MKSGKQAYCVVEIRRGEEASDMAKKLRDLRLAHSWHSRRNKAPQSAARRNI